MGPSANLPKTLKVSTPATTTPARNTSLIQSSPKPPTPTTTSNVQTQNPIPSTPPSNNPTPQPTPPAPIAVHPNERVRIALQAMLNMGYTNERGWLANLLEHMDADIGAILDILSPKR